MVRTVSNAFETGRIPQAWILTGVRGVGKTTTARILARALNYQLEDGSVQGPTIKMPKLGVHCQAIMESRHIDVLEMDAASHNSVDDVRTLTDASRYAPVNARYKVYILDEVHMLSTQAFNALLKTLEEPPAHVKFIFATTEIRKVPVTVLSRCQRFDLRRIDNARAGEASRRHLRQGKARNRDRGAGADRARRRRLGARRAVAVRSGHRACRRLGARQRRARDARPCRPHPRHRPVRSADEGRHRPRARRVAQPVRFRRRSLGRAVGPRRVHAFCHPRQNRAGGRRRYFAERIGAEPRPRLCHRAVDARAVAHLADAAQGHRRSEGRGPADRRRRDGAGAHRLCRRSADTRRGDPHHQGKRRSRRRATAAPRRPRRNHRHHDHPRPGLLRRHPRHCASAAMPPRGGPRAALAPSVQPAGDPVPVRRDRRGSIGTSRKSSRWRRRSATCR